MKELVIVDTGNINALNETPAERDLPGLRWPGPGQDRPQPVLRHPARNFARGPCLQPARVQGGGLAQGGGAVSG